MCCNSCVLTPEALPTAYTSPAGLHTHRTLTMSANYYCSQHTHSGWAISGPYPNIAAGAVDNWIHITTVGELACQQCALTYLSLAIQNHSGVGRHTLYTHACVRVWTLKIAVYSRRIGSLYNCTTSAVRYR